MRKPVAWILFRCRPRLQPGAGLMVAWTGAKHACQEAGWGPEGGAASITSDDMVLRTVAGRGCRCTSTVSNLTAGNMTNIQYHHCIGRTLNQRQHKVEIYRAVTSTAGRHWAMPKAVTMLSHPLGWQPSKKSFNSFSAARTSHVIVLNRKG
jgi:hypothetical protein